MKLQSRRNKLILTTKPALVIQWILFALMGVSICWVVAETDTPFTIFDSSASEKQLLIFLLGFIGTIFTGLIVADATQAVDDAWSEIYGHE